MEQSCNALIMFGTAWDTASHSKMATFPEFLRRAHAEMQVSNPDKDQIVSFPAMTLHVLVNDHGDDRTLQISKCNLVRDHVVLHTREETAFPKALLGVRALHLAK